MFDPEEERPKPKAPGLPRPLDPLSVEEMGDYIDELGAEIERVRAEIDKRQNRRGAAEALFGSKQG